MLFLDGAVSIFRAALGILNILESELMKQVEFNEMYVLLDSRPKELIKSPETIIKHMSKFMSINNKTIAKLREKNRPIILREQQIVWLDNSRAGCPTDKDTSIFKRVKLLNKFFLLNKAIRQSKSNSLAELDSSEFKIKGNVF